MDIIKTSEHLQSRNINEITYSIKFHAQNAAINIVAIGFDLMEAQQLLGHGRWLPWLQTVGISPKTA